MPRWSGMPSPAVPFWRHELPAFNPGAERPAKALWRGGCNWANMDYCHWSLLRLYGFTEAAELLTERLARRLGAAADGDLVQAREYLDPRPAMGSHRPGGGGASPFSWNGLLLAMTEGGPLDLSGGAAS